MARKTFASEKPTVKIALVIELKRPETKCARRLQPSPRQAAVKPDYAETLSLYTQRGDRKYLNTSERRRALAVMATLNPEQALFALTLAWTGARVSEVLALRASSFQTESGIVALQTLKRRRHVIREVPIPPELMVKLDQHFAISASQRDARNSDSLLWSWHRTTGWRTIKRVMARAGIVGRSACPRGLRHAFGVGSIQSGIPLNLVQRWLGHARLSTTAIYANASGPEELSLAALFWASDRPAATKCRKRKNRSFTRHYHRCCLASTTLTCLTVIVTAFC